MTRLSQKFALLGTALGISLGVSAQEPLPQPDRAERAVVEQTFESVKSYWLARGIGVSALGLRFTSNEGERAYYSHPANEVVVALPYIETIKRETSNPAISTAALRFVIAHEEAHAYQFVEGIFHDNEDPASDRILAAEEQADCLAGAIMQELYPDEINDAVSFIDTFGFEKNHGIGSQRSYFFLKGAHTGDCPF